MAPQGPPAALYAVASLATFFAHCSRTRSRRSRPARAGTDATRLRAKIGTPEGRKQLEELAQLAAAEGHDGAADSALLTKQVRPAKPPRAATLAALAGAPPRARDTRCAGAARAG